MKVLKYGVITATTTINLDDALDPSKYIVNINTNIGVNDEVVSNWVVHMRYGSGAYLTNKTSTSCTITVNANITASYEIIQITD